MIMDDFLTDTHSTDNDTTTVSADNTIENYSDCTKANESNNTDYEIVRIVIITTFPVILIVGTIGNALTFVIMQKGSLKHSSTCFYMAMLAVADTGECLRTCSDRVSLLETRFFSQIHRIGNIGFRGMRDYTTVNENKKQQQNVISSDH